MQRPHLGKLVATIQTGEVIRTRLVPKLLTRVDWRRMDSVQSVVLMSPSQLASWCWLAGNNSSTALVKTCKRKWCFFRWAREKKLAVLVTIWMSSWHANKLTQWQIGVNDKSNSVISRCFPITNVASHRSAVSHVAGGRYVSYFSCIFYFMFSSNNII